MLFFQLSDKFEKGTCNCLSSYDNFVEHITIMKVERQHFFLMESTGLLILFGPAFQLVLLARTELESLCF